MLAVPLLGLDLAACGAVLLSRGAGPGLAHDAGTALGLGAAAAGYLLVLAWAVAALLAVLAVLAHRHRWERLGRLCRRLSPALLRRAAAAVLGVQLLTAPAAAADSAPSPFWGGTGGDAVAGSAAPAGSRGPEAPTAQEPSAHPALPGTPAPGDLPSDDPAPAGGGRPVPPSQRTVDGAVTVVRGDTLWSLAAAHLGPDATAAQIARAWPAWFERNRDVLRDGPDRLLPGQRLLVPASERP
ncbi:MAG TPA: LysM peptidoglycan-binding domain-containing protein [Kocuria rosea]|nr:LysM peptidoglycan-binding domain-containing protein [Kocuria rosea]